MKTTGEISIFNATLSPALNAFGSVGLQTGLSPGGNDGFIIRGIQLEFSGPSDGTASVVEAVFSRGAKTSMPTILDDDVICKYVRRNVLNTSGYVQQDLAPFVDLPPQTIVVVESLFYLLFKTTGQAAAISCSGLVWCERVSLTDAEKSAILAQRLNNLLS